MKRYNSTYKKANHNSDGFNFTTIVGHMQEDSDGGWYAREDIEELCVRLRSKVCNSELCILEGHGPVPDMCSMCPIGMVLRELEGR